MLSPTPPERSPLWLMPYMIAIAVFAFIGLTIAASLPPLTQRIAMLVHCPNAVETVMDVHNSGTQRSSATSNRTIGTQTIDITCVNGDGSVVNLGNDAIAVTGMLGGMLAGALVGLVVVLYYNGRSRSRRAAVGG